MSMYEISIGDVSYKVRLPHASTDYIQGKLASTGEPYELAMLQDMASRLKPDDLVLDIGANIGNHTLYLANVAKCFVHAFEPNLALCEGLRESIAANNLQGRITLHQVGVSDAAGFATFDHLDERNLGAQSLTEQESRINGPIELIRLDDLEFDRPVRMIKIDVEGMEGKVLTGAISLLNTHKPMLYIEAQNVTDFETQLGLLSGLGYLYLDTFNATPTHLYIHESQIGPIADIARRLSESQLKTYANAELKEKLNTANLKYRESSEQVRQLKEQLRSRELDNKKLLLKISEDAKTVEEALVQLKHAQESEHKVQELNNQLKTERQAKVRAERALSAVKSSNTWKAGIQVRKASGSLMDAIKLPVRLYRLGKAPTSLFIPSGQVGLPDQSTVATAVKPKPSKLNIHPLISKTNRDIRIACIMDEFTFGSYQPEAQLTQLTPDHWQSELVACQPELLFIESAWRGKDELWGNKVGHCSTEVQGIVAWCNERGIPTLFWNKEDPIHFETFLTTAKLFDFVFTTDMDCIQRYKAALGHNQVYFLPFACQPQIHNPIEKYQRKDAFCFAGAYYVRYPDRTRDLQSFVAELPEFRPLEIYDRNYGKGHPDYQFPEQYQAHIVGTLSFAEIDKAYKGYNYAINLNSIKQSQSMFARRVYELLGSNTLTVSNYSRGLRLMFGDLVLTSDSGAEIKRRLLSLQEQGAIDRLRLAGLRKAMSEHTYADRLNYAMEKITGQARGNGLPPVHIIAPASSMEQVQRQLVSIQRQQGISREATLVVSPELLELAEQLIQETGGGSVRVISNSALLQQSLQQLAGQQHWVATMHPQDYYGSHYLQDILLATRYTQTKVIGKGSWHSHHANALQQHNPGETYQRTNSLAARRAVISPDIAADISAADCLQEIDSYSYSCPQQFAVDCYNYCANLPEQATDLQALVSDLPCNTGVSLNHLLLDAEAVQPLASNVEGMPRFTGQQLAMWLTGRKVLPPEQGPQGNIHLTRNHKIKTQIVGSALHIESNLEDGKHEYIYAAKIIPTEDLWQQLDQPLGQPLDIHFAADPGLNLNLVLLYLDAKDERISHQMILPNRNSQLELPDGATQIRAGLRVYAGGSADIKSVIFGHLDLEPGNIQGQSDVLLLTNHYPNYDDLYRNGFVHTRVRAYAEQDIKVDIFRLRKEEPIRWHEFQNADVTTGSQNALRKMLQSGRYRHVLVHFLDPDMWAVLKDFIDSIRVTVWVHGADIQPWYRRRFNLETIEQEEKAKELSAIRMDFWRSLLQSMPANLHMVFVSKYFASEVMVDLGFRLTPEQFSVIHNPIDVELFTYVEKDAEQRKRILSIRPYASKVYANDLSVKTVLELSTKPWFTEIEFRFVGDGPLFESTLSPLRELDNVTIQKGFLSQQEIASLHKEYGVFLCPSRYDTHGVSRDEAMSSGLVPVTSAVAAIPEFADESCAVLAPEDDFVAMAQGITRLVENPQLFQKMSEAAVSRVRSKTAAQLIISQEINLFGK